MTHKLSLMVVLWLLLISPQLAACAQVTPYPVKDSGLLTEEADLVWLDNQRVLFHGYKAVEQAKTQKEFPRYIDRGLYLWDTKTGAVELYDTFVERKDGLQPQTKLCVHDGMLTYVNRGMVVTGTRGQETRTPFPKPSHWFNPHSCRYYDTKPFWLVEGHRTIPLLEEHGYLDLGTVSPPQPDYLTLRLENPNPAISFYSVGAKKQFTLPIGWLEVGFLQVHYAPFRDAYLLSGLQYYDEQRGFLPAWPRDTPPRVWWLKSDGSLEKEELPNISPLQGNPPRTVPVRTGLFVVAGNTRERPEPTAVGGYLIQGQSLQRVINGMLRRMSVSPDGCKVAVVNDTHEKKPVSERIRLQIIQLCEGD